MIAAEQAPEQESTDRKTPLPKPDPRSDAELLRLFVEQHDRQAMTAIINRHGPLVMGLCRNILRNDHDAADAFQATFLVFLKKARSIAKAASLASWLHGVACRVALRARSQAIRRQQIERSSMPMTPEVPTSAEPSAETVGLIHEELANLPARFRLPLILCCLEGESREAAAQQLGWTVGSLKGRLERGREMLRSRLARRGLVFSAAMLTSVLAREALAEVPLALVDSTVTAGMLIAAGQTFVTAAVSNQVAFLAQGVLKTMFFTKLKIAGLMLLVGAVIAGGSTVAMQRLLAGSPEDQPPSVREELPAANPGKESALNEGDEQDAAAQDKEDDEEDDPKLEPVSIFAVVTFEGTPPEQRILARPAAGAAPILDESLIVDAKTGGIANVVMYLEKPPAGVNIPAARKAPVAMTVAGSRFVPHVSVVRVGQDTLLTNNDPGKESVHRWPIRNVAINTMVNPLASLRWNHAKPEKYPIPMNSDLRPWMKAYQMVLDHPWVAVSDAKGELSIRGLPPGTYKFTVWHEIPGYLDRQLEVKIEEGEATKLKLSYPAKRFGE